MVPKESFSMRGNILETSYGLVENENIGSSWRSMHCILLMVSAISGFVYYYTFAYLNDDLNRTCIIHIIVVFKQTNPDVIDDAASIWGVPYECDFCSYSTLVSSILALIFLVYFIMSGKGGHGTAGTLAQPWRIVIATILFSLVAFCLCFTATWLTYFGRSSFCDQLKNRNLTISHTVTEELSTAAGHVRLITLAGCRNIFIDNIPVPTSFGSYISAAEISGILNTFAWFAGFIVALSRFLIMPDFRLLRFDFILEPSRRTSKQSERRSRDSVSSTSSAFAEKISLPGSVRSSISMQSTAQTALTSLDQQSLKLRESSEDDEP